MGPIPVVACHVRMPPTCTLLGYSKHLHIFGYLGPLSILNYPIESDSWTRNEKIELPLFMVPRIEVLEKHPVGF